MDEQTLGAYERDAAAFAKDWHEQPPPTDLQQAALRYFRPGPTADIGCGSGRDTAWLTDNGFPAVGYDPSEELLAEARRRYPRVRFHRASLPKLDGMDGGSFTNVLCETVIMHQPREQIVPSVGRLISILKPGGTLYLTWRVTEGADLRDNHGRLYTAFDASLVRDALASEEILLDEQVTSASSGKVIHRIVVRKHGYSALKTRRIHIMGASGAGVSSLGRALADALGNSHHDTDDYFWKPSNPPYVEQREVAERLRLMREVFLDRSDWVLSGSLDGWGDQIIPYLDLVAFLYTPTEIRLERLRAREFKRFGAAVAPGGSIHKEVMEFLDWASHYDDGTREGRNLARHQAWLERLTCPVVRLDGARAVPDLVREVCQRIEALR